MEKLIHNIQPIFNNESRILILGSFPSPKSRENNMFYGNPHNRFWIVLSTLFNQKIPTNNLEKTTFLLEHKIALWDVIKECSISGASDASIANAVPNDLSIILNTAKIGAIFTTGKTATELFNKFFNKQSIYLPSPSPANFAYTFEKLIESYKVILEYLK